MILALETATRACSAALLDHDGVLRGESVSFDGPAHSRRLLSEIHAALAEAGASLTDVGTVVVSLGPGAFTGLRIGVATARALALAGGLTLGGVSTLEALALALAAGEPGASAVTCVPLIDGRRGEVFAACFRRSPDHDAGGRAGAPTPASPAWLEPEIELAVVPADDLPSFLRRWPGAVVGGDGAVLYADRLPPAVICDETVAAPTAAMVGRLWLAGTPRRREGHAAVLPIYGRRPDARPRPGQAVRP